MLRNDRKRRTDDIDNSSVDVDEVTDLPGEVPLDQSPPNASNSMPSGSNLEITGPRTNSQQNASEIVESSDDTGDSEIPSQQKCNDAAQMTLQRLLKKRDATAAGLQSTSHSFPAEMIDGTELMEPVAPDPSSSKLIASQLDCPQAGISWRSAYDNPNRRKALEDNKVKDAVAFIRGHLESGTATAEILHAKFNFPSCYDIEFIKLLAKEFKTNISDVLAKKRAQHKEVLNEFIFKLLL